ncbi:hypothetical protein GCM10027169_29360 [Gordonia jinhuaensis]|uniref:Uncharacterized protein n=1 Tax=Gordonia jinhuaensis TaxID=1517702 RepID=A0A916WVF7_9ACTN|nr:hypothetical protein GCM10011489_24760 [Gordonia jinhuaensis]
MVPVTKMVPVTTMVPVRKMVGATMVVGQGHGPILARGRDPRTAADQIHLTPVDRSSSVDKPGREEPGPEESHRALSNEQPTAHSGRLYDNVDSELFAVGVDENISSGIPAN